MPNKDDDGLLWLLGVYDRPKLGPGTNTPRGRPPGRGNQTPGPGSGAVPGQGGDGSGRGGGRGGGGVPPGGHGGGGGGAPAPAVGPGIDSGTLSGLTDTVEVLTDANGNTLNNHSRIQVVLRNITFTGTITSVAIEVSPDGGSTWRTTSGDYRRTYFNASATTAWGDSTNVPATLDTAPTDLMFEIYGMGIAGPTQIWSRDMTAGADNYVIGGFTTAAETLNAFRIVFNGTSVDLTGGTYEIYYGGANGLVLIDTIDASTGGPFTQTGLGDYSSLFITFEGVQGTASEGTILEFSADGGSSWDATTTYFTQIYQGNASNGNLTGEFTIGSGIGGTFDGIFQLHNFNVAAPSFMFGIDEIHSSTRYRYIGNTASAATAWDAIRISKASNDFTAGTIHIWGEKAAVVLIDTLSYPLSGDQTVDLTGYAQVNVVALASSAAAADYDVRAQLSGTPVSADGSYPAYVYGGVNHTCVHTGIGTFGLSVHDGLSSTAQRGAMQFHGWDMACPIGAVGHNASNVQEEHVVQFLDNTTAYNQMLSLDDNLNGGSVYITGRLAA